MANGDFVPIRTREACSNIVRNLIPPSGIRLTASTRGCVGFFLGNGQGRARELMALLAPAELLEGRRRGPRRVVSQKVKTAQHARAPARAADQSPVAIHVIDSDAGRCDLRGAHASRAHRAPRSLHGLRVPYPSPHLQFERHCVIRAVACRLRPARGALSSRPRRRDYLNRSQRTTAW